MWLCRSYASCSGSGILRNATGPRPKKKKSSFSSRIKQNCAQKKFPLERCGGGGAHVLVALLPLVNSTTSLSESESSSTVSSSLSSMANFSKPPWMGARWPSRWPRSSCWFRVLLQHPPGRSKSIASRYTNRPTDRLQRFQTISKVTWIRIKCQNETSSFSTRSYTVSFGPWWKWIVLFQILPSIKPDLLMVSSAIRVTVKITKIHL